MNNKPTKIDPKKIRTDFPFFKNNQQIVYLDTAATSLKPQVVIDAITDYYQKYSTNIHSQDYPLAVNTNDIFEDTRKLISKFINGAADEVIFCPSATFAYNQIAFSLAQYLQKDDEIILSALEHSSLLLPFYRLVTQKQIKIKFVETDNDGIITIANLKKVLSCKTKLVAFANINNSLAGINDTKELTKFIKDYGKNHCDVNNWPFANILVLIDGAQGVGHLETNVKAWGIDFFAFSAHKIFGPTGIGVWWSKSKWLTMFDPLIVGGGMNGHIYKDGRFTLLDSPYRFEAGTQNMAGVFGLQAAIKYLLAIGFTNMKNHQVLIKKYAIQQLTTHLADQIEIYNQTNDSGTLIFNIKNVFAQDVANYLGLQNICLRSGTYCTKLLAEVVGRETALRASFYIYTTYEDIDALVNALKKGINHGGDFLDAFF